MMKSGELVIIVESVEEAVKFYTEKLAFDIADLQQDKENRESLGLARLRKGKCFVIFRTPHVEELAEFSFIKRCASRCVGLQIDMKAGIEKYFQKCKKKGLRILNELKDASFSLRDPFGVKLTFTQVPAKNAIKHSLEFLDLPIKKTDLATVSQAESAWLIKMIERLKHFGILRRASKKYAKLRIKEMVKG